MRDIGTLGGDYSLPNALNDAGQVVGESRTAAGEVPNTFVRGLNDAGQVAGTSWSCGNSGSAAPSSGKRG
jgi:uncharacterized membrane protein